MSAGPGGSNTSWSRSVLGTVTFPPKPVLGLLSTKGRSA